MKKILSVIVLLILLCFNPQVSLATQGCCSWHGGESYCDYSVGRWVCGDGTYSPSCTCGGGYSPPAYVAPPTCPLNSYWNGSSCSCYAGFVPSGGACISNQQYCWNTLGYSSTYNYSTGNCECSYGYVYSGGTCELGSIYCGNNYGYNSQFNSITKICECRYGYVWNTSGTQCISEDDSCHNQIGLMSFYNSLNNTCQCLTGYVIIGGQCVLAPVKVYAPIITKIPTSIPTQSAPITTAPAEIPTSSPVPTYTTLVEGSKTDALQSGLMLGIVGLAISLVLVKMRKSVRSKKTS